MNLALTTEQRALREALRELLADACAPADVLSAMETAGGTDPGLWSALTAKLGLPGLLVPEELGGTGLGVPELALVCEELGRVLPCVPAFSTGVLAPLILLEAAEERAELLTAIAAGESIMAVALGDDPGRWGGGYGEVSAAPDGVLSGWASYVLDGHLADTVLVTARTAEGTGLFAVDAARLERRRLPALDLTRPMARLEFDGVQGRPLARGEVSAGVARALDLALVALGAEQVGGIQRCLDLCVEHGRTREQFGRPIGSFQAVKHLCADMLRALEPARSAVRYAAAAGPSELPEAAALVKAHCPEVYFYAAAEAIQIHGAIGFSWEHELHLHFKRAKSGQVLFGGTDHHLRVLAGAAGFGEEA